MDYSVKPTTIIHFDDDIYNREIKPNFKIQYVLSADIFKAVGNKLPIIVEGQIKWYDDDLHIFSCIFHTKVLLIFAHDEQPITSLIKMLSEVYEQERETWINKTKGNILEYTFPTGRNDEVLFNKAYQIIEAARKSGLLK